MMILLVSVLPAPDSPEEFLCLVFILQTRNDDAGVASIALHRSIGGIGNGERVRRTLVDFATLKMFLFVVLEDINVVLLVNLIERFSMIHLKLISFSTEKLSIVPITFS